MTTTLKVLPDEKIEVKKTIEQTQVFSNEDLLKVKANLETNLAEINQMIAELEK